jgi:signal transduction histidine kinase
MSTGMNKESLLVVDEESEVLETIRSTLNKEGYAVDCAQSSLNAVTLLRKKTIDLLITSLAMPELTAPVLLQQAQLIQPSIGSIVISNGNASDLLIKSFKAGAQAVLVKPFTAAELKNTVEDVLQKGRIAKENMRLKTLLPLFEFNKSIVSELNAHKIFNEIVRLVCIETRTENASIMLLNEASRELIVTAALGLSKASLGKRLSTSDDELSWSVVKTGKALLINAESKGEATNKNGRVMSSLCVPLSIKGKVIGVINCTKRFSKIPFTESDLELLSILAGQAAIAIENAKLFDDVQTHRNNTEVFLRKCLTAQEDERRRISTELHDGLAQWISSASYALQLGNAHLSKSNTEKAREEINRANDIIHQSIKELRRVILNLHPSALAELGMVGALQQNVKSFSMETDILGDLIITGDPRPLSSVQEITVYRVVSEALNNVRKHSRASVVTVKLTYEQEDILIEIMDNGKGFNLDETLKNEAAEGNLGLVSMRERAEMIGGSLDIDTSIAKGTKIMVRIPVPSKQLAN